MARQIARLQLPVLRAALGDPTFFSSRRHPVRRFVNRVASLGAAFEDFADEGAQRFLDALPATVHMRGDRAFYDRTADSITMPKAGMPTNAPAMDIRNGSAPRPST